MTNDLTSFILRNEQAHPVLPLMHTTDAYRFRDIIRNGKLEPSQCNVFKGECLTYLFYGRPAYKLNTDGKATSQSMRFPVCFLVKNSYVKIAKRVFPFDSGAFAREMFKLNVHERMELSNFLIDPDPSRPGTIPTPEIPARLVKTFYESNRGYYDQLPREGVQIDAMNFEAEVFYEWIKTKQKTGADSRRASIEIQIEEKIELSSHSVEAIALPISLLSSDEVKTVLKNLGATPLPYDLYHGDPAHFTMSIHAVVKDYLKAKKLYA